MQSRPAIDGPVRRTVVDVFDPAGPRVRDDMSVEVALSVMDAARTGRLVVCDQDDQGTGLVTRAELVAVRDGSAYSDRVCLRDILGVYAEVTSPATTVVGAGQAMRRLRSDTLPVVDEQNTASAALALSR
ncbi:CBS domain-containing protein [Streptomyces endophyticus]|uniref:CBS domain-containing protein n=2 Tax=Streptomyces endophyticus TaxID=714166 RepID=A0ABU6F9I0_9ACTN|nr:CBS domain-containing protein [Streptomyces endophyticus]MEB8340634.1 CBS domain-containing protein [Streptomyces endophyticus]